MMMAKPMAAETAVGPVRRKAECGRDLISVQGILHWAFAVEFAGLDYDEDGTTANDARPARGAEYAIMQSLELGFEPGQGVKPDTFYGRSHPHADAELVATTVRHELSWPFAAQVAQCARLQRAPVWDLGVPKWQPVEWARRNRHGQFGKTEVCGRHHTEVRGRVRGVDVKWTPITCNPHPGAVASARRAYLNWYGSLLSIRVRLQGFELKKFVVTNRMPERTPWKKSV